MLKIYLEPRHVANAYRIGKYNKDKRRPILIKLSTYYAIQLVWDKRALIPGPMYLKQAYPENIAIQRRILQQIVNKARSMDQYKEKANLRLKRIVINDRSYTVDNLAELPTFSRLVWVATKLTISYISIVHNVPCLIFIRRNSVSAELCLTAWNKPISTIRRSLRRQIQIGPNTVRVPSTYP